MPAVVVNEERCNNSQTCLTACPYNAIGMIDGPKGLPIANIYDNCIDCMLCVPACPEKAILMVSADGAVMEQEVHSGIWAVVFDAGPEATALVAQANSLARPLGTWTGVILLGSGGGESTLQAAGADIVVHHGPETDGDLRALTDAVAETVAERQPEALLLQDNPLARSLAACLAWRLQVGLVTEVRAVENDLSERRLLFHKVSMDSPITAVVVTTTRPQLGLLLPPVQ